MDSTDNRHSMLFSGISDEMGGEHILYLPGFVTARTRASVTQNLFIKHNRLLNHGQFQPLQEQDIL